MRPLFVLALSAALHAQSPVSLLHDGHFKRARPLIEAQYKANPNDAETLWLMSKIRWVWKDKDAAERFAQQSVAAGPKDARFRMQLLEVLGEKAEKASLLKKISLGRELKKELDTALVLDPKNIDALMGSIHFYFQAPGIAGGDKAKARAAAEEIMKIDPVEGFFARATVARYDKQNDRLEGIYREAAQTHPASYAAQLSLANFLTQPNNRNLFEAETRAREAVKLDRTRIGGHVMVAITLAIEEKWTDLEAALTAAEKAVPDDLVPQFRAANVCLSTGKELPRAETWFRKYLTMDPEPNAPTHANAHWRLGLLLEKQGRKPDAIAELQAAIKLDPESPAKNDLKRLK